MAGQEISNSLSGLVALTTFPAVQSNGASPKPANVQEAATQFESLLIAEMLRSAHASSPGSLEGEDEDSQSSTLFDIAGEQFAEMMAKQGGLGLAQFISRSLGHEAQASGAAHRATSNRAGPRGPG